LSFFRLYFFFLKAFLKFFQRFLSCFEYHVCVFARKRLLKPIGSKKRYWNWGNFDYICEFLINTSQFFPHLWLITGFVTRLTRRVPLVWQELPTLPEPTTISYTSGDKCFHWIPNFMVCYDSHDDKDIWYTNNNKKSLKIPKGN
jgi:hypothetical protein